MASLHEFMEFINSPATEYLIKNLAGESAAQVLKMIKEKWEEVDKDHIYALTSSEREQLKTWFDRMDKNTGAIAVGPTIKFTQTSMGDIVEAEFKGQTLSLRSSENW